MDTFNVSIGDYQVINVVLGDETPDYVISKEQIGLVADTTFTDAIPAGYSLEKIFVRETAGNNVTGFKIGTTAGIDNVVSIENVAGNETIKNEPNADLDFSSAQTLFISATGWGTGVINCYFILHRVG